MKNKPTEKEIEQALDVLQRAGYQTLGLWQVDDVIMYAEQEDYDITEEEAEEIFDKMSYKMDASIGISWNVIDYWINNYLQEKELTN